MRGSGREAPGKEFRDEVISTLDRSPVPPNNVRRDSVLERANQTECSFRRLLPLAAWVTLRSALF